MSNKELPFDDAFIRRLHRQNVIPGYKKYVPATTMEAAKFTLSADQKITLKEVQNFTEARIEKAKQEEARPMMHSQVGLKPYKFITTGDYFRK